MRYGFWLPVFGGWLRNVEDEQMPPTWDYVRDLTLKAEALGYDCTLIAELNLNDIKGPESDSLDAWTTTAALAAVTSQIELMAAGGPHSPPTTPPRCSRSKPPTSTASQAAASRST